MSDKNPNSNSSLDDIIGMFSDDSSFERTKEPNPPKKAKEKKQIQKPLEPPKPTKGPTLSPEEEEIIKGLENKNGTKTGGGNRTNPVKPPFTREPFKTTTTPKKPTKTTNGLKTKVDSIKKRIDDMKNTNNPQDDNRKKKGSPLKILIIIVAIICVIAALLGTMVNSTLDKVTYNEKIANQYVSTEDLNKKDGVYNILLLGVDARTKNGEKAEDSRSDSMMVVCVDTNNKCIKTVSFLRDMWVYIPCKDMSQKLNAACQYGGFNGVSDTIEYNYGIDIDGYVVVDFTVFKEIVNAIGGVEIKVTKKEAQEVNNHQVRYGKVHLKSGKRVLNGQQALAYSRIRKIDDDFQRSKRQRKVINSIIKGVKAKPYKLYSIADSCAQYIKTDLSKKELMKIAVSALPCLGTDMLDTQVPFAHTWEYGYVGYNSVIKYNKEKNRDMLAEFLYEKTADEIKADKKAEK